MNETIDKVKLIEFLTEYANNMRAEWGKMSRRGDVDSAAVYEKTCHALEFVIQQIQDSRFDAQDEAIAHDPW